MLIRPLLLVKVVSPSSIPIQSAIIRSSTFPFAKGEGIEPSSLVFRASATHVMLPLNWRMVEDPTPIQLFIAET